MSKNRQIDLDKAPGHIESRRQFFSEKRAKDETGDQARAKVGRFIRVNGSGFRAISLEDCGSLYEEKNGEKRLLGATRDFRKAQHYCSVGKPAPAGNKKRELRLQGWLIGKALIEPKGFASLLCLDDRFEELRFVTDEFNLVGVRADIIALGRKWDAWYPVFIELKVRRSLKELVGQLDDISRSVAGPLQRCFHKYLEAASGVPEAPIRNEPVCVLVWPATEGNESKDVMTAREKGIVTISYRSDEGGYTFRRDT